MVGGLTFRGYTREEVGRMTLRDIMILSNKNTGPEVIDPITPEGRAQAIKDRVARQRGRETSWEPD